MPTKRTMRSFAMRSGTRLFAAARSWAFVGFQGTSNVRFIIRFQPFSTLGIILERRSPETAFNLTGSQGGDLIARLGSFPFVTFAIETLFSRTLERPHPDEACGKPHARQ